MKILMIELSQRDYKCIQELSNIGVGENCLIDNAYKAIRNGTVLPENPTNGDVIKALFPSEHDFETDFDANWWNAPYKSESEG